jgi:hypothetical protein
MSVNRNQPCPCGSNKKFKKCCYLNESKKKSRLEELLEEQETDPTQYFGYDNDLSSVESPVELPDNGMRCMVSEIVAKNKQPLIDETEICFEIGDWFVSEVIEGQQDKVHGLFKSEEEALDFGRTNLNVITYRGAPILDIF